MKRVRLGLYLGDREYGNRFTQCLMNHYREQLELHIYTESDALWEAVDSLDVAVLSDCGDALADCGQGVPIVYLYDVEVDTDVEKQVEGGVYFVDKYQEVNKIVDEILKQIGEEIKNVRQSGSVLGRQQIIAVYALSENEYQLPFAVTLASILSEKERVLLLDLQENSGLSQMVECTGGAGIEELLVMAESGKYSQSRLVSCIGHLDHTDVVYPANNTEYLCEVQNGTYQKLFRILEQEMDYGTIILNMGSRFVGFFDLLSGCSEICLMKSRGGLGQWREKEFYAELEMRGSEHIKDRLQEITLPLVQTPLVSCERLVEQWKWNELGDSIRRMVPELMSVG
jgi:hypothetical protein